MILLLPVAVLGENLYETNASRRLRQNRKMHRVGMGEQDVQDVDRIEFESDRFPDRISRDNTCLGHTSVVQDLLCTGAKRSDELTSLAW